MQTTTFTAPDIECAGCANSIKKALSKLSGVESVDVDIEAKTVRVAHSSEATKEILAKTLDKAGFPL